MPGVLVVPSWLNVNESICRRADRLAELGYAAFVADLFGSGVRPAPTELPMTIVGPFLNDRLRFRRRLSAGLRAFQQRPECDAHRVAAIGYCIGGCGVLELARAAAPLRGVVSLHGILTTPIAAQPKTVASNSHLARPKRTIAQEQAIWSREPYASALHRLRPRETVGTLEARNGSNAEGETFTSVTQSDIDRLTEQWNRVAKDTLSVACRHDV
jgi:dienelactone hydrolase